MRIYAVRARARVGFFAANVFFNDRVEGLTNCIAFIVKSKEESSFPFPGFPDAD